jgi:spore coat protein U-like protein
MTGPSGTLQYNLYLDATRQTIWGDGTAGTQSAFQDTRANEAYFVSVYGRIPSAQNVQAGTYTDMLVVTVLE